MYIMKAFIFLLLGLVCYSAQAQYASQAGLPGSTAISATSSLFESWATQCTIYRGCMNIAEPSLGLASAGDSMAAIGPADGLTVSLGDSGIAVVTFANPIFNGPGPDLAVFENGFLNPSNDSQAFLELGFVEVSSDGINYTRFPATSLTPDNVQIDNDSYIYANNLNNLAGSYIAMYGTPFDLDELAGTPGLDINNITHVRIVDVIGDISDHSTFDSAGRIVNDPYPTPYPSCGFDLDAVGVINEVGFTNVKTLTDNVSVSLYPNPATDKVTIEIKGTRPEGLSATLTTLTGTVVREVPLAQNLTELSVIQYPAGMYYLVLHDANGNKWIEKVIKR